MMQKCTPSRSSKCTPTAYLPLRARIRRKDAGVALLAVVVMIAVIGATAGDFAYNARVDFTSAINARDELRTHYLALSAMNMSRLLLRVQKSFLDPMMKRAGGMDLQVADYAPLLLSVFNSKEGTDMIGGLLGIDTADIKGIGVEKATFDLEMTSLDGRININCAGGANTGAAGVMRTATALGALFSPERYNRLFEEPDENGDYHDRLAVLRAIVDWADQDTVMYGGSAPEDYRYNARKDRYESKDQYYDTLEELRLVRGVDDEFMAAFADQLTIYGPCKTNISLAGAPTIAALIVQYAKNQSDPALAPRNLALLARYVYQIGQMRGGFAKPDDFVQAVKDPVTQLGVASAIDSAITAANGESTDQAELSGLPPVMGIDLDTKVTEAITGTQPRQIWKITASAEAGRVKKRITGVWDQTLVSMQASRHNTGPGGFVYWREE